ncbi:hypothetical protein MLD38_001392 [Melastoma candidum]|uniref:Uncharacterized protein n=1 Tax=Melastoma candidum TaxID=119954 RepID=A0ACB9SE24_9MYRT|nr:hypothetical protein MLD38_001392 [Melastoma candidum]
MRSPGLCDFQEWTSSLSATQQAPAVASMVDYTSSSDRQSSLRRNPLIDDSSSGLQKFYRPQSFLVYFHI